MDHKSSIPADTEEVNVVQINSKSHENSAKENISFTVLPDTQAAWLDTFGSSKQNFYSPEYVNQSLPVHIFKGLEALSGIPKIGRTSSEKYSQEYIFGSSLCQLHWFFKLASNVDTKSYRHEPCN